MNKMSVLGGRCTESAPLGSFANDVQRVVTEVVAKVMFLLVSVILSTGGVCLSACWDTATTPQGGTPLAKETPQKETPCQGDPHQEGGTPLAKETPPV